MVTVTVLLELQDIVKTFPGNVVANDHVSLSVTEGEIHGLLGENGAGKSTLMKILYGLYSPDGGTIRLRGTPITIDDPQDAIDLGIGMVHQHFMLIPRLTVLENVVIGGHTRHGRKDRKQSITSKLLSSLKLDLTTPRQRIEHLTQQYGLDIDPDAPVHELDIGQQQRVEILKALFLDVDLLILDEPSAVLSPTEVETLFSTLRQLVEQGLTIIFITHKLAEVTSITDRVTVLRNGKVVGTVETDQVTRSDLAEMMVGRDVLFEIDKRPSSPGSTVLRASDLVVSNDRGLQVINGIDLELRSGEIVGLAGVSGNGQAELAECLVGVRAPDSGTIEVLSEDLTGRHPRQFIEAGVSYVPEDRLHDGCAPDLDMTANAILKNYPSFVDEWLRLDYGEARQYTDRIIEEYDIRTPGNRTLVGKLSGGNIQKLILARELSRDPEVIVVNQPTRGLDVGAIEYIRNMLLTRRDSGTGIFLISEDLDEVIQMSDRIIVIYEGQFVFETSADNVDRELLGQYMTSGRAEAKDAHAANSAANL